MNTNNLRILADKVKVPVYKLSAATMKKVNGAPQCQRVTAPRKKPVKMVGDFVFKVLLPWMLSFFYHQYESEISWLTSRSSQLRVRF